MSSKRLLVSLIISSPTTTASLTSILNPTNKQTTSNYFARRAQWIHWQALESKRRKIERADNTDSTKSQSNKNKKKNKGGTSKPQSKDSKCTHCGRTNHATKGCWFSPENKGKSKTGKSLRTKRSWWLRSSSIRSLNGSPVGIGIVSPAHVKCVPFHRSSRTPKMSTCLDLKRR